MSEEARQALSKWLRHHRQDDEEGITVTIARQACDEAADLIDQQAAEIADLKLYINRWNSGDNSIGCKYQVKRLKAEIERLKKVIKILDKDLYNLTEKVLPNVRDQRDEWRRRAELMMDWLGERRIIPNSPLDNFLRKHPEAAQWFDEKENK